METMLYQLELNQDEVNCGSSHIVQLKSGKFVIFDGGYFTAGEEDRLYRFLTGKSNGTPVIAAWFFSHAHQDHVGNFIQFMRKHGGNVHIQRLSIPDSRACESMCQLTMQHKGWQRDAVNRARETTRSPRRRD